MRLSILTPIVTGLPGSHGRWEDAAGIDELVAIARAGDALGYHHMNCSEHVAVPAGAAAVRGGRYWDPLATFGHLSALTGRIRFATHVLVLGYHHPLEIAKRYGTLDAVSGGRVVLGVGVGSLREEFDLLGAEFDDRGPRADDALAALRASLSVARPVYEGTHYRYGDVIVDPCAVQPRVPIWVGGRTRRSLRRAVALADGWAPFGFRVADLVGLLAGTERPAGFEVVYEPDRPLDPSGDPAAAAEALRSMAEGGVTIAGAKVVHHSLAHYLEQLEAFAAVGQRIEAA